MLTRTVKQRLADDVQLWVADGIISTETAGVLRARYQASGFGAVTVVKYLGVTGGVLAVFGILGLVAALADSAVFGGALTLSGGAAMLAAGLWLARDPRNRYAFSSRAVIALGALGLAAGIAIACQGFDASAGATTFVTGLLSLPLFGYLAYRTRNGFVLVLATIGLFHWAGSWSAMLGRSTYALEIDAPVTMSVVAVAVFGVGMWHARHPQRFLRFDLVYQAVALVYFNLSLLILSIGTWHSEALPWVIAFTAACLAQIVLGARLQNALLLGFGVSAAGIDLFTRYFEAFWDRVSLGAFLALGGAALLAISFGLERVTRLRGATP